MNGKQAKKFRKIVRERYGEIIDDNAKARYAQDMNKLRDEILAQQKLQRKAKRWAIIQLVLCVVYAVVLTIWVFCR